MQVQDFLKLIDGKIITGSGETVVNDFYKDSRLVRKNGTYIAIIGEKFDGNDFVEKAIDAGASVCIISKENANVVEKAKKNNTTLILVADTLKALQGIAKYKRSLFNIPVVAVTGSVGKTSTKDMIASVLSSKYNTLKTKGNMNNNIGMPMTILELNDENAMVVEMGMNHFGEIELLTDIAKPTIAVITNIGTAHIGNLGSRENILKAKLEILDGMKKKILVINNDNDLLHKFYLENKDNPEIEIHTYGIENKSEVMGYNIRLGEDSSWFDCKIENDLENKSSVNNISIRRNHTIENDLKNKSSANNDLIRENHTIDNELENRSSVNNDLKNEFSVEVPVGGLHFIYNSLCAITVANLLNLNQSEIKCGIKNFVPTKNRMDITKLRNGVTIINDSYNASFDSMQMLLNYLSNFTAKRRIAVLGDMLELGDYSKELHEKVGKEVAKNNVDILIVSGENSKYIAEQAIKDGMNKENVYYFDNGDKIYNFIEKIWREGDCILFKASNGMRFFEIADKLIAECGK